MLVTTSQQFDNVLKSLKDAETVIVDLETTGLQPYLGDRLCGVALYTPHDDQSYYIPFRHGEGTNYPLNGLEELKLYLSDPSKNYFGWNVKFDVHFLLVDNFPILDNQAVYRDVMLALHTLDENRYDLADKRGLNYKLKDNGRLFLGDQEGEAQDDLDDHLKARGLSKGEMWKLPGSLVASYAEQDVILTWKLYQHFIPYLAKWGQIDYFIAISEFNGTILVRMEHHGVPVNRDLIGQHILDNKQRTEQALNDLKTRYGDKFNPNSPVQVRAALGTKDSRKITLQKLGSDSANEILDYKNLSKAEGTFYKPYLHYSSLDSRVHASFNIGRTTSRRLSSSDPNLQQVPRYTEKYRVKEVFTALPGYKFIEIDYSQQELRLGCHFSGQENMTEEYLKSNPDVHTLTASHIFMVEQENITEQQRQVAKSANFGFSYGMGIMKAGVYIASNLKPPKSLLIDQKFYTEYQSYMPKHDNGERITWEEFSSTLTKMYAGVIIVEDAKALEKELPDEHISIWTTTKILHEWRNLYSRFTDALRATSALASQFRLPDGTSADVHTGYKFYRLEDGCVRHYIKGQRPFTAWNFLVQGTGAYIMRTALMRIHRAFPFSQDEVIPIISVHDSIVFLIKDNENFTANLKHIKELMEDFNYYPPMKVDIKVGNNWGQGEKYALV